MRRSARLHRELTKAQSSTSTPSETSVPIEPRIDKIPPEILYRIAEYLITPSDDFEPNPAPKMDGKHYSSRRNLTPPCLRGLNVSVARPLLHLTHTSQEMFATLTSPLFEPVWKRLYLTHLRLYFYGDQPGENGPWNTSVPGRGAHKNGGWDGLIDQIGG